MTKNPQSIPLFLKRISILFHGFAKKSMANKVITMQLIRTIIQSLEKGFSIRHISRDLNLWRKTVTLYAVRLQGSQYSLTELRQLDDAALALIVYAV